MHAKITYGNSASRKQRLVVADVYGDASTRNKPGQNANALPEPNANGKAGVQVLEYSGQMRHRTKEDLRC
jgi:hypothetical protein